MKVPSPAAMIGAVETTKSAAGFSGPRRRAGRAARAAKRPGLGASPVRGVEKDAHALDRREDRLQILRGHCKARDPHLLEARTLSRGFPSVVHRTRSGDSATIRSTSGSLTPPIFGRPEAAAGTLQNRVTPTREPSRPRRKTISVRLGARGDDAARRGGEPDGDAAVVLQREGEPVRPERGTIDRGREEEDGEDPRENSSCDGDPDMAQNGSSPGRCLAEQRMGGVKPRVLTAKAPRPFSAKASRISPAGRFPGFRLPGGLPGRPPTLRAFRPRYRPPGSGSVADFVTGYSCGQRWTRTIFPCPDGNVPICATILRPGARHVKTESPEYRFMRGVGQLVRDVT